MQTSQAHICIVSDRLLPNLIPILMRRPRQVFLIASADMVKKGLARRLEQILDKLKFEVTTSEGLPLSHPLVLLPKNHSTPNRSLNTRCSLTISLNRSISGRSLSAGIFGINS